MYNKCIIKKGKFVKRNILVVGIDIGKHIHKAVGVTIESDFTKPYVVSNNRQGFEGLIKKIGDWKRRLNCKDVVVGFESTGHYWKPLGYYLIGKGIEIVEVSTKFTKKSREMMDNNPLKDDVKDSRVIADLVRQGKVLTIILPKGEKLELRELVHTRENFMKERTSIINRLHKIADITFPERGEIIKAIENKTSLYLLRESPFPDDILKKGRKWLSEKMRKISHGRYGERKIWRLYLLANESVGLKEGIAGFRYELFSLLSSIEILDKKIEDVGNRIRKILGGIEESRFIESIKGIGMITTASIISETGGISNYRSSFELEKIAGLNIYEVSSGNHKGQKKITKIGRSLLRQKLYYAALQQTREGMPLYYFYRRLVDRGTIKVKAIIAVARKLLALIFALVRDKREYEWEYAVVRKMAEVI
ncbi:IS110 family transposase [candidate division TA06 bacterium]|uniref:IS110 family transposase n=1 Tax=candidate division TA06 bacterium TaxID=2250710 RepID=A0A660SIU1_UNCT6|nr:MAG: IS110 family transposase [candidate division TA06 bacterium]